MAHNLQRILEEAVCNACRHSGASFIRVVVEDRAGNLELSIHDNGLGFRGVLTPQEGMGMGIQGMRERVALMGGRLEVESAPGSGTIVRAQVPRPAAANAA
jgi:signal transduction histidine kinase